MRNAGPNTKTGKKHNLHFPEQRTQVSKLRCDTRLGEWLAAEAIVRQKDREETAASIAKLSNKSNKVSVENDLHLSNEVFESEDRGDNEDEEERTRDISSRTVSADKISTITEVRESCHYICKDGFA